MARKRFRVQLTMDAVLEVEEDLLQEVMKPEWQREFYVFLTEDDAVAHIAYNRMQDRPLTSLDGFAHRKPADAVISGGIHEDVEVLREKPPKKRRR